MAIPYPSNRLVTGNQLNSFLDAQGLQAPAALRAAAQGGQYDAEARRNLIAQALIAQASRANPGRERGLGGDFAEGRPFANPWVNQQQTPSGVGGADSGLGGGGLGGGGGGGRPRGGE